jgi:hypothetical protein
MAGRRRLPGALPRAVGPPLAGGQVAAGPLLGAGPRTAAGPHVPSDWPGCPCPDIQAALAAQGRDEEASEHLQILADDRFAVLPFDANWLSAIGEAMQAALLLGDGRTAEAVYAVLAPYAGRQLAARDSGV